MLRTSSSRSPTIHCCAVRGWSVGQASSTQRSSQPRQVGALTNPYGLIQTIALRAAPPTMLDSEQDDQERRDSEKGAASPSREDEAKHGKKALRRIGDKLFAAAEDDDVKKLQKIVERKYRDVDGLLNLRDEKGRSALHLAARCEHACA